MHDQFPFVLHPHTVNYSPGSPCLGLSSLVRLLHVGLWDLCVRKANTQQVDHCITRCCSCLMACGRVPAVSTAVVLQSPMQHTDCCMTLPEHHIS
jgi:hypothetical protein